MAFKTIAPVTAEDVKGVPILNLTVGAALAVLVTRLQQAHYPNNTVEYVAQDALFTGIKAIDNSKGYSQEMLRLKGFKNELEADPSIAQDPKKMARLMQKYRIGASVQS